MKNSLDREGTRLFLWDRIMGGNYSRLPAGKIDIQWDRLVSQIICYANSDEASNGVLIGCLFFMRIRK